MNDRFTINDSRFTTLMNNTTEQLPSTEPTEIFTSVSSVDAVQPAIDDEINNLRSENTELKNQLRLRTAREEFTKLLTAERAHSPELLFQAAQRKLVFDEDGKPSNFTELLADLKTRFPEQFVADDPEPPKPPPVPSINSGAGRQPRQQTLTKEMLARLKPREIAALDWNEVKQVLEQ
jgi:hypothetical protein